MLGYASQTIGNFGGNLSHHSTDEDTAAPAPASQGRFDLRGRHRCNSLKIAYSGEDAPASSYDSQYVGQRTFFRESRLELLIPITIFIDM